MLNGPTYAQQGIWSGGMVNVKRRIHTLHKDHPHTRRFNWLQKRMHNSSSKTDGKYQALPMTNKPYNPGQLRLSGGVFANVVSQHTRLSSSDMWHTRFFGVRKCRSQNTQRRTMHTLMKPLKGFLEAGTLLLPSWGHIPTVLTLTVKLLPSQPLPCLQIISGTSRTHFLT